MSKRNRNWVLLMLCVVLFCSALACGGGGDGDLVNGMLDANETLQDTAEDLTDSGWLK